MSRSKPASRSHLYACFDSPRKRPSGSSRSSRELDAGTGLMDHPATSFHSIPDERRAPASRGRPTACQAAAKTLKDRAGCIRPVAVTRCGARFQRVCNIALAIGSADRRPLDLAGGTAGRRRCAWLRLRQRKSDRVGDRRRRLPEQCSIGACRLRRDRPQLVLRHVLLSQL